MESIQISQLIFFIAAAMLVAAGWIYSDFYYEMKSRYSKKHPSINNLELQMAPAVFFLSALITLFNSVVSHNLLVILLVVNIAYVALIMHWANKFHGHL